MLSDTVNVDIASRRVAIASIVLVCLTGIIAVLGFNTTGVKNDRQFTNKKSHPSKECDRLFRAGNRAKGIACDEEWERKQNCGGCVGCLLEERYGFQCAPPEKVSEKRCRPYGGVWCEGEEPPTAQDVELLTTLKGHSVSSGTQHHTWVSSYTYRITIGQNIFQEDTKSGKSVSLAKYAYSKGMNEYFNGQPCGRGGHLTATVMYTFGSGSKLELISERKTSECSYAYNIEVPESWKTGKTDTPQPQVSGCLGCNLDRGDGQMECYPNIPEEKCSAKDGDFTSKDTFCKACQGAPARDGGRGGPLNFYDRKGRRIMCEDVCK